MKIKLYPWGTGADGKTIKKKLVYLIQVFVTKFFWKFITLITEVLENPLKKSCQNPVEHAR